MFSNWSVKRYFGFGVTEYLAMPCIDRTITGDLYAAMSAMSDRVNVLGRERIRL